MWMRWTRCWSTPLAALVVMPTVHNPLGCTMPTAAKQRLAELVNARQLPLIEDAVYAELQFCEPPAPLLKAFDRDGWVMVVGFLQDAGAGLPHRLAGWRPLRRAHRAAEVPVHRRRAAAAG
jgi:hypothetical protein